MKILLNAAESDTDVYSLTDDSSGVGYTEYHSVYELTKFLYASQENNLKDESFCKLKIDHEKFAMLLPLPRLLSAGEVDNQIKNLIISFEKTEYIKHFSFENSTKEITRG